MSRQDKSSSPLPNYHYGPPYRPSWENLLRGAFYIVRGKQRSLARDALLVVANMPVPPLSRGEEHIPERGPFIVVANHYERPGLWMAWPALLVSQCIRQHAGQDVHWVAIEEWESFQLGRLRFSPELIRRVFERAFATYGILAMPSRHAAATARASAMRLALQTVKRGEIIGLMPEGDVGATPELLPAREGVGAFLLMLAGSGAPVLPVALYEEAGRLVAHFGPSISLELPAGIARTERDQWVRDFVMQAIKGLLPQPLWGYYRDTT